MPRPLTGELGLAAASEKSEFVHLLDFQFSNGDIRMTTGTQDLVTEPYATRIDGSVNRFFIRNPVNAPWPTDKLSVEAWIRKDVGSAGGRYFFSYAVSAQFDEIIFGTGAGNELQFIIHGIGTTDDVAISLGVWHHVVGTWDAATDAVRIYLDGVLTHSATVSTSGNIAAGGSVVLGQDQDSVGGGFAAGQAWLGDLDNVRVYRRVLSAAEVLEHFNGRFVNEQKLVALWKFDTLPGQRLVNPGFEAGDDGNWTLATGITIVNDGNARTGSFAAKYATDGVGGPNLLCANSNALTVKPGDLVYAEAWMKAVSGTGTTQLAIRWRDANHTQIQRDLLASITGPIASYTQVRGHAFAPLGAVFAILDIGENVADNTLTPWYFDDCVMSRSSGLDSGPLGNHMHMVGILDSITDTILRRTWSAVGGLLRFGGVEEASDPRGQGVDVQLSGVTQTAIAALMGGTTYRGRLARIWRAHIDQASGTVIDDPLLLLEGLQLAPYEIQEDRDSRVGGTVTVRTRIRGRMGVERLRGIWSNLISHQHVFPGDTFFRHVVQLANSKVYWGVPYPWSAGGGGGGGFSDSGGGGDEPQDAI